MMHGHQKRNQNYEKRRYVSIGSLNCMFLLFGEVVLYLTNFFIYIYYKKTGNGTKKSKKCLFLMGEGHVKNHLISIGPGILTLLTSPIPDF